MRDHILSEQIAKNNGVLFHCMYCNHEFDSHDKWSVENNWFSTYILRTCGHCKREHRFNDKNIHTLDDVLEMINKKK